MPKTIKEVTSIADLLFKSKTQEAYRRLLIEGVQDYIYTAGRPTETYEQCVFELDKYTSTYTDCSSITRAINTLCSHIYEPEEYKMHIVKNRESTTNISGDVYKLFNRPSMQFNNDSYQEWSRTVDRQRGNNTNRPIIEITHGPGFNILRRNGINPRTGEQISVQVTMSTDNLTPETTTDAHAMAERELNIQFEERIEEIVRNRRSHIENMQGSYGDVYDDLECSEENPCSVCQDLNEERGY